MKDKIREIFNINELFEEWKQFLSWCYENNDKTVEIHRDKLKWVMDYITNLQKTNKNLKGCIEDTNINYKNIITNLEEELKSANESISWWQNRFNAVEKENERLKKDYGRLMQDNAYTLELEQRNEKAIELLNREYWINEHEHNDKVIDELLNILQGGFNE